MFEWYQIKLILFICWPYQPNEYEALNETDNNLYTIQNNSELESIRRKEESEER